MDKKIRSFEDRIRCQNCSWSGKVRECKIKSGENDKPDMFSCPQCKKPLIANGWLGFQVSQDATVLS